MTDADDTLLILRPREPAAPMAQKDEAHDEDAKPKANKRRREIDISPLLQNRHQQAAPATSSRSTQRVNKTVAKDANKELQRLQKQFSVALNSYDLYEELYWEAVKEVDALRQELSESVIRMTKVQRQMKQLVQNQMDQLLQNEE
ncbi:hypothetical protein LX32DRAFT_187512 [Colletotrichum zoysiae]|uniref:Uncharacterized protein n=1 Tax=Colletotrichum zoysiae TaxID=1216348 RepID=A0AAD9LYD1_9PEZI|nr:hypothetical protein LX32DRAFT_187512 [Colletotrichum zoysiae]